MSFYRLIIDEVDVPGGCVFFVFDTIEEVKDALDFIDEHMEYLGKYDITVRRIHTNDEEGEDEQ